MNQPKLHVPSTIADKIENFNKPNRRQNMKTQALNATKVAAKYGSFALVGAAGAYFTVKTYLHQLEVTYVIVDKDGNKVDADTFLRDQN